MIMGDLCTRSCRFCAVAGARQGRPLRNGEPKALALAASGLGLRHVLITSVDRDDLPDRGAGHFAACIGELKKLPLRVEALIPDYTGAGLEAVLLAGPDVLAHNVETVPSLQKELRDPRASFEKSLSVLREAKSGARPLPLLTKTSILLGLGETEGELLHTMDRLRGAETDILVLGQYLRPTEKQLPVREYISPERFAFYRQEAEKRGFRSVLAAPLARTSYRAGQVFARGGAFAGGAASSPVHFEGTGKPPGCKLIRLSGEAEQGVIRNISIRGDFFASPEEEFEAVEEALRGVRVEDAAQVMDSFLQRRGIEAFGISGSGFAAVLASALGGKG
jgi:lipoic acid synthetase